MSIVRKTDGTLVVGVRITLKPGRDDDLIALVLSAKRLDVPAHLFNCVLIELGELTCNTQQAGS